MDDLSTGTDLAIAGDNTGPVVSGQVLVPLPFTFEFYETKYNDVYVNNNGYLTFTAGTATDTQMAKAQNLDGGKPTEPNLLIAGCWQDYKASDSDNGRVAYETFGTTPNRVFVVGFEEVSHDKVGPVTKPVATFQIKLFEFDDSIEVHVPSSPGCQKNANSENGVPGFPVSNEWNSAGIEADAGSDGISYFFADAALTDSAVRYEVRNSPPTANADAATMLEDGAAITIDVLGNDADVDGHTFWLQAHDTTSTGGGTITLDDAGTPTDKTDDKVKYKPKADYCGTDTFDYTVRDQRHKTWLPSESDGTVTVTVKCVNDAPVFTAGADVDVLEDSGAYSAPWASGIGPGGGGYETSQTVTFTIDSNSAPALFASAPTVSSTGQLAFTPADDATGVASIVLRATDDGGTSDGGVNESAPHTLTITIGPVNDAPVFTAGGDVDVLEDSGAYGAAWAMDVGPGGGADEAAQTLTWDMTVSDATLFLAGPALDATGQLTFTPAADANGVADIEVRLKDDGGTSDGGSDTSEKKSFKITVKAVNDAPDLTPGADITLDEDAGPQTFTAWLASRTPGGGADEAAQVVDVEVVDVTPSGALTSGPAIDAAGTLTFTPAADFAGTVTVTLRAKDDGGTADGGEDAGLSRTFKIDIGALNDAPVFMPGADVTVLEDSGAFSGAWASGIGPGGGADEAGQTTTFVVTPVDAALFSVAPAIDAAGVLTFTPAADAAGTTNVDVVLRDDGGTAGGGQDESSVVTFTIAITPVNDAPTIAIGGNVGVPGDGGLHSFPAWATGIGVGGGADETAQSLSADLVVNDAALFSTAPSLDLGTGALEIRPVLGVSGTTQATITLHDDGGTANGGVNKTVVTFFISVDTPAVADEEDEGDEEGAALTPAFAYRQENLAVEFFDRSTTPDGPVLAWLWDFGDGTTDDRAAPTHIFGGYGPKTVTLTVRDAGGSIASVSVQVFLAAPQGSGGAGGALPGGEPPTGDTPKVPQEPEPPGNAPLVADAGPDMQVGSGARFTLDGSRSEGASTYTWTETTGTSASGRQGQTVQLVAPPGPARLVFRLVVSDGDATDEDEVVVEVAAPETPLPTPQPLAFTATMDAPRTWVFEAETALSWDFGDGASAEGRRVTHTYADEGVYRVVARGPDGLAERTVDVVDASPDPVEPVLVPEPVLEATVPGKEAPEAAIFALAALNVAGVIALAVVASRRRVR